MMDITYDDFFHVDSLDHKKVTVIPNTSPIQVRINTGILETEFEFISMHWRSSCYEEDVGYGNAAIQMKPIKLVDVSVRLVCDTFTRSENYAVHFGVPDHCDFDIIATLEGI